MTEKASDLIGRDFAMEARALTEGWNVPPAVRKKIVSRLIEKLMDENTSIRDLDRIDRILARNTRLKLEIEKMILDLEAEKEAAVQVNVQVNNSNNTVAYFREALSAPRPVVTREELQRLAHEE